MMISKTTIVWRSIVLGLLAVAVPLGMLWQDRIRRVDVDSMLDVSVSIKTISHVRVDSVGDSVWQSASGSGFLVSANDCEVWTNHHVIADAAVIEVYPRHWRRAKGIPATVINSSPRTDFALLRMQNCDGLTAARLGVSGTLQAGDEVYAVGNPLGSNPDSISRGIVSHANRYLFGAVPYIQTDAAINRGNSGGALFNRRGDVIGVNTAIMSMGQAPVGIGYALPVDIVKREAIRLHAGPPSWGQAGIADVISDLTPEQASVFGVPNNNAAVVLTQTPTDGPSVGKLISRDVIYQIENVEITDTEQLKRLISSHEAGQVISLQVVRGGVELPIEITLAEGWEAEQVQYAEYYPGYFGMTVEAWTEENEERGRFDTPVITKVQSLGPAHMAQISSSQKTVARKGPFLIPVQLDVKTITGVVYHGTYEPVLTATDLDKFGAIAAENQTPILLEIETWARSNPLQFDTPLERRRTTYHTLVPSLAAELPDDYDALSSAIVEAVSDNSVAHVQ